MTAETANDDLATILALPKRVTINGIDCDVRHMKTREFFAFLGVFTGALGAGAGQALAGIGDKTGEELQGEILGIVMVCAPLAVDPLLELIKKLVEPVNAEDAHQLRQYLDNPELDDMLTVVDAVIENEKDNIPDLLGKAKAYMERWATLLKPKKTARTGRGRKRST